MFHYLHVQIKSPFWAPDTMTVVSDWGGKEAVETFAKPEPAKGIKRNCANSEVGSKCVLLQFWAAPVLY